MNVSCYQCEKVFLKSASRYNESIKFGWKQYCSGECQSLGRQTRKTFSCCNPACKKTFQRAPSGIVASEKLFCSSSCSAKVNNTISPKRIRAEKPCSQCKTSFKGRNTYCSSLCLLDSQRQEKLSGDEIIERLKGFYKDFGRIPLKTEFLHTKAARNRFGAWNKAVMAAGLKPNPVLFARRHLARDGHWCNSFAEMIIDNWLSERAIEHETNVPYPESHMTADFKIRGTYVEFFGLKGVLSKYDKHISKKKDLWKKYNLESLEIYPKDLFPNSNLEIIFKRFLPRSTNLFDFQSVL